MTGEFSEEGAIETGSLSRTHTLAIGEETGQKERVIVHSMFVAVFLCVRILY